MSKIYTYTLLIALTILSSICIEQIFGKNVYTVAFVFATSFLIGFNLTKLVDWLTKEDKHV